jgi:hypothetical protein
MRTSLAFLALAAVAAASCGGSVASQPVVDPDTGASDDTGDDTAPPPDDTLPPPDDVPVDAPPAVDHGAPSDIYPAFPLDVPQLQYQGGSLLKSPVVVTVTWASDPNGSVFEDFGDKIGASAYWKAITSEYGIAPAISGSANHVRISSAAPASMTGKDVATLVANGAGNPSVSKWPAPTAGSVYIVYIPNGTSLIYNGSPICGSGTGGYHSSVTVAGKQIAYAVIPECTTSTSVTSAASHEIGEAVTDPYPGAPGYVGFDLPHLAWEYFQAFQIENGDVCEFYIDSFYKEGADLPYDVQRQWSNASAKAGHAPCVPAPVDPYFNTTPLALEDVTVDFSSSGGSPATKTRGYHVAIGETRTFAVGLWSDAKRTPWNLKVVEGQPALGPPATPHLTLSIDSTSGVNGKKAYVTVKVNSTGKSKGVVMAIESYTFGVTHFAPVLISSN